MNVALFASAFYPHVGGVEELVRQVGHELQRQGIGVIILTNRWPRSLPKYEVYEGLPIYRLAMRVPEGSVKAHVNYFLTHRFIRNEVTNILRRHKIDLIHVHCVSSNGYYALLAREALGLPLVVTTHGERTMDATQIYQRSAFLNRVLRDLLAKADHITAVSRHTLDDMEEYWGKPFGSKASVIYNGIDPSDFETGTPHAAGAPYIMGIGRLVAQKGFDILIRAFAQANIAGWKLLIAGEGGERAALEGLIRGLGLEGRAELIGRADRAMAVGLFLGCEYFVLPSRMEPLGIVNLEAMAAGKAIIASDVGGVPEIVSAGETGLLVPSEDVDALAIAMVKLASDPDFRNRLGDAGRRAVGGFTLPAITGQYAQIYSVLTANQPEMAIA
jgi:glycosyltransferase involved in cell wall biosynthesis